MGQDCNSGDAIENSALRAFDRGTAAFLTEHTRPRVSLKGTFEKSVGFGKRIGRKALRHFDMTRDCYACFRPAWYSKACLNF